MKQSIDNVPACLNWDSGLVANKYANGFYCLMDN